MPALSIRDLALKLAKEAWEKRDEAVKKPEFPYKSVWEKAQKEGYDVVSAVKVMTKAEKFWEDMGGSPTNKDRSSGEWVVPNPDRPKDLKQRCLRNKTKRSKTRRPREDSILY